MHLDPFYFLDPLFRFVNAAENSVRNKATSCTCC